MERADCWAHGRHDMIMYCYADSTNSAKRIWDTGSASSYFYLKRRADTNRAELDCLHRGRRFMHASAVSGKTIEPSTSGPVALSRVEACEHDKQWTERFGWTTPLKVTAQRESSTWSLASWQGSLWVLSCRRYRLKESRTREDGYAARRTDALAGGLDKEPTAPAIANLQMCTVLIGLGH